MVQRRHPAAAVLHEAPAQRAEKETLAFKYNSVSGVSGCIVPVGSRVAWHAANRLEGTACDPTIRAAALQKLRGPGEVPPSCYQVRRSRPTTACEEGNCAREMKNKAARNHCPLSVLTCVLRYSDSRPVGSAHSVASTDTISQLVNLNIERFTCLTIRRLDRGPRRRVCTRARSAVHFSGPWDDRQFAARSLAAPQPSDSGGQRSALRWVKRFRGRSDSDLRCSPQAASAADTHADRALSVSAIIPLL